MGLLSGQNLDDLTLKYVIDNEIDNKAVSKDGDTIKGRLIVDGAYLDVKSTNLKSNTTVGSTTGGNGRIYLRDSNGTALGILYPYFRSDGKQGVRLLCDRFVNGTEYINNLELGIDSSAHRYVELGNAQSAWLTALGLGSVSSTTTVSDVISAGTGITISAVIYSSWGKLAMLGIEFSYNSSISTTKIDVGTLKSGKRPTQYANWIESTGRTVGDITTGGVIRVRVPVGGSSVAANTSVTMRAVYLLA